jgi:hypothetical protein
MLVILFCHGLEVDVAWKGEGGKNGRLAMFVFDRIQNFVKLFQIFPGLQGIKSVEAGIDFQTGPVQVFPGLFGGEADVAVVVNGNDYDFAI